MRLKLTECGWRDEMKEIAKDMIRSRGGVNRITVDELVSELLPRGRASVPEKIKGELIDDIQAFNKNEENMI